MMLACPGCGTVYEVPPARLGARPRLVRCSACATKWSYPPHPPQRAATSAVQAGEAVGEAKAVEKAGERPSPAADPETSTAAGPANGATGPAPEPPAGPVPDLAEASDSSSEPLLEAIPPVEPAPAPAAQPEVAAEAPTERRRRIWQMSLRPGWAAAASATATVVGIFSLLVVLRGTMVAALPFSAGLYGLVGLVPQGPGAGLEFQDITSARQRRDGTDVLTVSGIVSNIVNEPAALPPISILVLDAEDVELQSVSLETGRASLAAGERLAFDKEIPNPNPRAKRVRVSFVTTPQPAAE